MDYQTIFVARDKWQNARRRAFWAKVRGRLLGQCVTIYNFNEVSRRLHLSNALYRGQQTIPLDRIVGSVGRYEDFVEAFLPLNETMGERWQGVAIMFMERPSSVPPIEVFKLGEYYFVKDGNHRVSVARELGVAELDAYVWEYPLKLITIPPDGDLSALLLAAERSYFYEATWLRELRPASSDIRLTSPGGYNDLLAQVLCYQEDLSRIDQTSVSFEEAVTAWYDMIYETTVGLIAELDVMKHFPERTPADLFVWVMRHRQELEDCCQRRYTIRETIADLREQPRGVIQRWLHRS
jgi:hypothetical protein